MISNSSMRCSWPIHASYQMSYGIHVSSSFVNWQFHEMASSNIHSIVPVTGIMKTVDLQDFFHAIRQFLPAIIEGVLPSQARLSRYIIFDKFGKYEKMRLLDVLRYRKVLRYPSSDIM